MNIQRPVLGLFIISFFASCAGNEKKTPDAEMLKSKTYVQFTDAKKLQPDWSKDNALVFMWKSDPAYLHPANTVNYNGRIILWLTQSFLFVIDQTNKGLAPVLAKSLPKISDDQLEFTYELLDEATWDDGTPITTDDVIFTFKAFKNPLTDNPSQKPMLENLKTIIPDPSNPKRFTMVMKRKYIQSISFLTDDPILSRKFYDANNVLANYTFEQLDDPAFKADQVADLKNWSAEFNDGKYGNDLNFFSGAGPYKVVDWDRGHTVTLQRKQNHWTEHLNKDNIYLHSFPEKIIFKVVQDENAMSLECKTQTIDATTWLSTKALVDLQHDSTFVRNYNAAFMENYNVSYIVLNMRPDGVKHKKIFDDVKVRRAMALLTPVDKIIDVITYGKSTRWPSMVSPLKPEYDSTLQLLPYDVAQASKLLDEAGWKDTDGDNIRDKVIDGEKIKLEVELIYGAQGNIQKDIMSMMTEASYAAGVKIIPQPVESSVLRQKAADHDFDMAMSAWAFNSLPEDYSQIWSSSSWASKGSNFGGFGNAASDALIDSINITLDDSLRIPMVKRLEKMVYDEQPYIWLYSTYRKTIIHKRWGNAIMTSDLPGVILNNLRLVQGSSLALLSDPQ